MAGGNSWCARSSAAARDATRDASPLVVGELLTGIDLGLARVSAAAPQDAPPTAAPHEQTAPRGWPAACASRLHPPMDISLVTARPDPFQGTEPSIRSGAVQASTPTRTEVPVPASCYSERARGRFEPEARVEVWETPRRPRKVSRKCGYIT